MRGEEAAELIGGGAKVRGRPLHSQRAHQQEAEDTGQRDVQDHDPLQPVQQSIAAEHEAQRGGHRHGG